MTDDCHRSFLVAALMFGLLTACGAEGEVRHVGLPAAPVGADAAVPSSAADAVTTPSAHDAVTPRPSPITPDATATPPPPPEVDAAGAPPDAEPPPPPPDAEPPPPPLPDAEPPQHCASGPLALPINGCRPAPPPLTGDPAADCVARINQLRAECQCLPPLVRWAEAEACADTQAEYDSTRGPHTGFNAGICAPSGFGQNECPGYPSTASVTQTCLQQMWDEGPGEPFVEHGHYINMTNPRFSRVACGLYTTPNGGVWAVQNFQ